MSCEKRKDFGEGDVLVKTAESWGRECQRWINSGCSHIKLASTIGTHPYDIAIP